jgi:hypothetical protein
VEDTQTPRQTAQAGALYLAAEEEELELVRQLDMDI